MDVYWSTVYPLDVYADYQMLYREPDPLFKGLLPERDDSNPGDFFACPAFQYHTDNTFVVRAHVAGDVRLDLQAGTVTPMNDRSAVTAQLLAFWPNSRKQYRMLNLDHRLLVFAEGSLVMSTMPAFMHRTEIQSKLLYIPASFDIGSWLRPLQGTYELMPDVRELHFKEGDPLYYIKFHTDAKVRLRRFKLTPAVHDAAHGCVHYKMFRPQQSLDRVYDAFAHARMPKQVLEAIRANLLD
jgi:hypothetical protein